MFNSITDLTILDNKKILGEGAYSEVIKVRNKRDGKIYALKKADMQNLTTEIQIHKNIKHPNIIRFHSQIRESHMLYFLLEYAANGCLFFYIDSQKGLPEKIALKIFYQTTLAIQDLHKKDIIHRDIKPENVLLDEYFNVKLCDLGWACVLDKKKKRKSVCGTYEYMAPEIFMLKEHDKKVDVWCLGVLLYEMIEGAPPFEAGSLNEIRKNFREKKILFRNDVSEGTKNLIFKMLRENAEERIDVEGILESDLIKKNEENFKLPFEKNEIDVLFKYYVKNSDSTIRTMPEAFQKKIKIMNFLKEGQDLNDFIKENSYNGGGDNKVVNNEQKNIISSEQKNKISDQKYYQAKLNNSKVHVFVNKPVLKKAISKKSILPKKKISHKTGSKNNSVRKKGSKIYSNNKNPKMIVKINSNKNLNINSNGQYSSSNTKKIIYSTNKDNLKNKSSFNNSSKGNKVKTLKIVSHKSPIKIIKKNEKKETPSKKINFNDNMNKEAQNKQINKKIVTIQNYPYNKNNFVRKESLKSQADKIISKYSKPVVKKKYALHKKSDESEKKIIQSENKNFVQKKSEEFERKTIIHREKKDFVQKKYLNKNFFLNKKDNLVQKNVLNKKNFEQKKKFTKRITLDSKINGKERIPFLKTCSFGDNQRFTSGHDFNVKNPYFGNTKNNNGTKRISINERPVRTRISIINRVPKRNVSCLINYNAKNKYFNENTNKLETKEKIPDKNIFSQTKKSEINLTDKNKKNLEISEKKNNPKNFFQQKSLSTLTNKKTINLTDSQKNNFKNKISSQQKNNLLNNNTEKKKKFTNRRSRINVDTKIDIGEYKNFRRNYSIEPLKKISNQKFDKNNKYTGKRFTSQNNIRYSSIDKQLRERFNVLSNVREENEYDFKGEENVRNVKRISLIDRGRPFVL